MGWIGCFSCEKFRCDFVAWTFAPVLSRLAPSFLRQPNSPKCTQIVENRPILEFRVQWGGSGAFVAKNSDGTKFFTSLTRFTLSVVTQPNSPKCTQIIRNTPKHEFRVQWGGSGVFVAKIPTRLRGTNFYTSLTRFALSVVWQPKSPKCTQIIRKAPKCEFRVNGSVRVLSLRKIPMRLRGMNFCTGSARSAPSFVRQPNSPKCTKIVQIAWKQKFRVQWGGSGAFVAKNSNATSWHELLHQLTRFALSVVGQKTVPNAPK